MFSQKTMHGAYYALSAYVFWGFVPIYFKWVDHVSPWEILSHRVIWSVVLLLGILAVKNDLPTLRVSRSVLAKLAVTSGLLAINWLVFISAIVDNNIVETALGYFINPLVSVLLGMIFLGERLRPLQWIAVTIAATGIAVQLMFFGAIPWIALTLAFSFGFYGLIRKNLNLPSITGLALETLIAMPFAIVFILFLTQTGESKFLTAGPVTSLLLVLGGFVTSFPLLCFAAAVTRLSLTAAGMFQYIAPTLSLLVAVILYNEPFGLDRLLTFSCIWIALIIFSCESLYHHQKLSMLTNASV